MSDANHLDNDASHEQLCHYNHQMHFLGSLTLVALIKGTP